MLELISSLHALIAHHARPLAVASALLFSLSSEASASNPVDTFNVTWDSPSKDSSGSMPIGNGDLGLNVWVEPSGDLLLLIGKSDSVSENSDLLKLGRVRVKLTPNPLQTKSGFKQELHLRQGEIVISGGDAGQSVALRVWVDANHPVIHVEADGETPFVMESQLELWRTEPRTIKPKSDEMFGHYELRGGPDPVVVEPDIVLPVQNNCLTWYHRNERSIYAQSLTVEHLEALIDKYPDPLLHRTFGACMKGPGMVAADDHTIRSAAASTRQQFTITALTAQTPSVDAWRTKLGELDSSANAIDLEATRAAHRQWWQEFWDRSWINVTGDKKAEAVASGYALQRWVEACSGRGGMPIKYNGSIFTVGKTFTDPEDKSKKLAVPDWRAWGSNFWFQNQRHLYWPLIVCGDDDLLAPWFKMYMDALPLVTDKTRLYYHHAGACFQETIFFWGIINPSNFGWKNKNVETENTWIKRYWSGGIEMTAMMLDRFDYTQDAPFARSTLVPFAEAITTFYDQHWKRGPDGKILFDPAQSLETWQQAVNPLPEIAGLRYILPRLIALPQELTSDAQRAMWQTILADLPPVPTGAGADGQPVLIPAEKITKPANSENTELYAIYPYRLYGVGKPNLDVALRAYRVRRFPGPTCWSQDPMDAALLGLADQAKSDVTANFSATGARFQAFWKPGHDWIPDEDNGGAGMQALQWMLMQCDGRQIRLLPAWPKGWDADFKLHAPYQTEIEAKVHDGRIIDLKVTPASREKDVVIGSGAATTHAAP